MNDWGFLGVPTHFMDGWKGSACISACGIFNPPLQANSVSDTECRRCRRTKAYKAAKQAKEKQMSESITTREMEDEIERLQKRLEDHPTLTQLAQQIYLDNVAAGWYSDVSTGGRIERNDAEMIALMHSELSEALEGIRKDLNDDHLTHRKMVDVELADTIIRILDYCGYRGIDIASAVTEKLAYNKNRADHKVANRRNSGGKKF